MNFHGQQIGAINEHPIGNIGKVEGYGIGLPDPRDTAGCKCGERRVVREVIARDFDTVQVDRRTIVADQVD